MSTTDPDHIQKLDTQITAGLDALQTVSVTDTTFSNAAGNVEKLLKLKNMATPEPEPVPEPVIDKDRVRFKDFLPVIASLGGILVIVTFEAFGHTIGSKATAFVSKSK